MSLAQGSLSLKRFLVLGPVPDEKDLVAGLAKDRFRHFEDGLDEERMGWVDWRNPLLIPAEPEWVIQERFALFALRLDTRRVPNALLKAHVDMRLRRLMAEKDLVRVGREARVSVQDEVKMELMRKVLPALKIVDIAWDLKGGQLWTTASASKSQEALSKLFMKSFGCELQPMAPLVLASRVALDMTPEALAALDPLDLSLEEIG